ncbi:hypothetical protein D3C81_1679350 [compost metagenome]
MASTATGGKVCPTAAMVSTSGLNSVPHERVTTIPAPMPMITATRLEIPTRLKWANASARKLSC